MNKYLAIFIIAALVILGAVYMAAKRRTEEVIPLSSREIDIRRQADIEGAASLEKELDAAGDVSADSDFLEMNAEVEAALSEKGRAE